MKQILKIDSMEKYYVKLALRNMKRSFNDYSIYFITVTLAIALMFAFLSLAFSEEVLSLAENMTNLTSSIGILSVFITLMIAFTIGYATKFIVSKRKKEFATYLLFGMEKRQVANMFFIENGVIGLISLIVGILLGSLISQVFMAFIMNIFDSPYQLKFEFSLKTILFTFLNFIVMYGISTLKAGNTVKKQKIIELMKSERENENIKVKSLIFHSTVFIFSIILSVLSIWGLNKAISLSDNSVYSYLLIYLICLNLGIIGIYCSLPIIIIAMQNNNHNWKYNNTNLFFLKQINSKINTTQKTMGILAVLLTVALCSMSFGLSLGVMYKVNIKSEAPFDVSVGIDVPNIKNFNEVINFIDKQALIKDYVDYKLYKTSEIPEMDILSLSDYNKLRKQLGLAEKKIADNQFIVHCDTWYYNEQIKQSIKEDPEIKINGNKLSTNLDLFYIEPFEQYRTNGTNGYAVIFPDSITQNLKANKSRLVVTTLDPAQQSLKSKLNHFVRKEWNVEFDTEVLTEKHISMNVGVKSWSIANGLTALSILSFGSIYLSLTIMILIGTILALQQLFDSNKNKYKYYVLSSMGVSNKVICKLILSELLVYFAIPLVVPTFITVAITCLVQHSFGRLILMENVIPTYTLLTFIVFFIIYIVYFVATYVSCKRCVID